MRQIKFRGTDANGKLVYGDYHQYSHNECAIGDGKHLTFVEPDSVAQLVYVKDGKEYYEGDELIKDGRRWKCHLVMQWNEEHDL